MKWSDIITQVRDRLQEESETFFSNDRLLDIARRVQMEIATVAECLESSCAWVTTADIIEYDLPPDCLNMQAATCDAYPLNQVDFRRVHAKTYPVGQPACYYIFGNRIGLYPAPSGPLSLKVWYSQRPPLGAMTITHSGVSGATSATVEVQDNALVLVIAGGAYAGVNTFQFSDANYSTVGKLAAAITALNKGWIASRVAGCSEDEPASNLEIAGAASAYQKTLTLDCSIKLPEQFQFLIELGTIYRALWKDTEYEAGEAYRREYVDRLEALRRLYARRNSRSGTRQLRDAYRSSSPGSAGIRVFIP
jgi:hypothetical protein